MATFRELKLKARTAIAERFKVRAFVFPAKSGIPKTAYPRVHTEFGALGSVMGTNLAYATRQDEKPRLIFVVAEWLPKRGDNVVISAEEGYIVEAVDPVYNITQTAFVRAMTKAEITPFPLPDAGELIYSELTGRVPVVVAEVFNGPTMAGEAVGFLPQVAGEIAQ